MTAPNCVVCFSERDDLLTQWKTYGSWGPDTRLLKVKYTVSTKIAASGIFNNARLPIADNVALSASQFKHPGFSSEAEWRLMIATIFAGRYPFEKTDGLCFRASSRS
jgi:hypothetical protein